MLTRLALFGSLFACHSTAGTSPDDSDDTDSAPPDGVGSATVLWPASARSLVTLVIHAPDGRWVDRQDLGPGGSYAFDVEPGTSITMNTYSQLTTIRDVRPGDQIDFEPPVPAIDQISGHSDAVVGLVAEDPGEDVEVVLTAFCADGSGLPAFNRLSGRSLPTADIRISSACSAVGSRVHVAGWVLDLHDVVTHTVVAEGLTVTGEGVTLPPWGPATATFTVDAALSAGLTEVGLETWVSIGGTRAYGYESRQEVEGPDAEIPVTLAPPDLLGGGVCVRPYGYEKPYRYDLELRQACGVPGPDSRLRLDDFGPEALISATRTGLSVDLTPEGPGTLDVIVYYNDPWDLDTPFRWRVFGPAVDAEVALPDLPADARPDWLDSLPLRYDALFFRSDAVPDYDTWRNRLAGLPNRQRLAPRELGGEGAVEVNWVGY